MKVHQHIFERINSPENLFQAWDEFRKGKSTRKDVQEFEWRLEQNIFALHRDLAAQHYRHEHYTAFTISDPKQRRIHKATVRDRILHHAVFSVLNPIFEPTFIAHSFSCRKGKGTHKAVTALEGMLRRVSRNATQPCFALKCDIHKFFASVDHTVLLQILSRKIKDEKVMKLLEEIIHSFAFVDPKLCERKGIPIGNLTSQLFANVYMNELDQFMKQIMRLKHYIRYTDDFVVLSRSADNLQNLLPLIRSFLQQTLHLDLHPHKVTIRKYHQGIDFLGYILLPYHRLVRKRTKQRMIRTLHARIEQHKAGDRCETRIDQSLQSYLGVLCHANTYRLRQDIQNQCWFWLHE